MDTGAEVSVFPASRSDRQSPSQGNTLTAANGSSIRTYGKRAVSLNFNNRHFRWTFTIAQVSQPLLGADFLRAHSLLVDIKGQRLIDTFDFTSITLRSIPATAPHLDSIASADDEFASCWPNIQTSQAPHSPTHPLSTGWSYSSPPKDHPSTHVHVGFHRTS